ncbi:MAG: hypothetical protein ACFE9D_05150 [Promethearchaeota archaeon]
MQLRIVDDLDELQDAQIPKGESLDPIKKKEASMANQFHRWLKDKQILPGGYTIKSQGALVGDLSRQEFGLKLLLIAEPELDLNPILERSGFETSPTDYRATLGFNLSFRDYENTENRIRVLAWNIVPPYIPYFLTHYRGAHGTIFVFDVRNKNGLECIPSLHDLVKDINGDVPIALVGHKPETAGRRKITRKAAQTLADQLEILYHETKNPNGSTLEPVLEVLVPRMLGFAKY